MSQTGQPEDEDAFGLDKEARIRAKRERETEEAQPEPLDPPFPFRVIAFDQVMVQTKGMRTPRPEFV